MHYQAQLSMTHAFRESTCRAALESLEEGLRMDAVRAVHAALMLEAAKLGIDKPARATFSCAFVFCCPP